MDACLRDTPTGLLSVASAPAGLIERTVRASRAGGRDPHRRRPRRGRWAAGGAGYGRGRRQHRRRVVHAAADRRRVAHAVAGRRASTPWTDAAEGCRSRAPAPRWSATSDGGRCSGPRRCATPRRGRSHDRRVGPRHADAGRTTGAAACSRSGPAVRWHASGTPVTQPSRALRRRVQERARGGGLGARTLDGRAEPGRPPSGGVGAAARMMCARRADRSIAIAAPNGEARAGASPRCVATSDPLTRCLATSCLATSPVSPPRPR